MNEILIRAHIRSLFEHDGQALLWLHNGERGQCLHVGAQDAEALRQLDPAIERVYALTQTDRDGRMPRYDFVRIADESESAAVEPIQNWYSKRVLSFADGYTAIMEREVEKKYQTLAEATFALQGEPIEF